MKIIACGVGGSFQQTQLTAMAFSASYVKTAATYAELTTLSSSVTSIVEEGNVECQIYRLA